MISVACVTVLSLICLGAIVFAPEFGPDVARIRRLLLRAIRRGHRDGMVTADRGSTPVAPAVPPAPRHAATAPRQTIQAGSLELNFVIPVEIVEPEPPLPIARPYAPPSIPPAASRWDVL